MRTLNGNPGPSAVSILIKISDRIVEAGSSDKNGLSTRIWISQRCDINRPKTEQSAL